MPRRRIPLLRAFREQRRMGAATCIALMLVTGCTQRNLTEGGLDGPTTAAPITTPTGDDAVGPVPSGRSPAAEMRGVMQGLDTTPPFRSMLDGIDTSPADLPAAAGGYDAVTTIAVAAEVARTDSPGRIAAEIIPTTKSGRRCIGFVRCRAQALRNVDLDLDGLTGGIELLANGDPGQAMFTPVTYSRTGALTSGTTRAVQEAELLTPPAQANPNFGPAADGVVRIGTLLPVTGPNGATAAAALAGIQRAVDDINDAGGVLGVPLVLIPDESGDGSPAATNTAIGRLVAGGADAVIGGTSIEITAAAIEPLTAGGIILFSPTDRSRLLAGVPDRGLFFRTAPPQGLEGLALGTFLAEDGITRAAIVAPAAGEGRDLANDVAASVVVSGGTVVAVSTLDAAAEAGRAADELVAANPGAIVVTSGSTATAALVRELVARNKAPSQLPLYGTTTNMVPELVISLGEG